MTEEKKELPANFIMEESMKQQLTTLDKLNKQGGKENDDANAKTN